VVLKTNISSISLKEKTNDHGKSLDNIVKRIIYNGKEDVVANRREAKVHQAPPLNKRVINVKEKIKDLIQKVIRVIMESMDTVMVSAIIMDMVIVMENIDKINLQVQLIKL
jgi:ribosomal protein L17